MQFYVFRVIPESLAYRRRDKPPIDQMIDESAAAARAFDIINTCTRWRVSVAARFLWPLEWGNVPQPPKTGQNDTLGEGRTARTRTDRRSWAARSLRVLRSGTAVGGGSRAARNRGSIRVPRVRRSLYLASSLSHAVSTQ